MSNDETAAQKSSGIAKQQTLSGDLLSPDDHVEQDVCERCGAEEDLHRHHISYYPEKVATLCRSCHQRTHTDSGSPFAPEQEPGELFLSPEKESEAPDSASVTIKKINKNSYFYWIWRDGGDVRTEFLCRVDEAPSHPSFSG